MNNRRKAIGSLFVGALALLMAPQIGPNSSLAAEKKNPAGGNVMPASAGPSGYSLDDVAGALARFSDSQNDPALLPDTPFQVIYTNGSNHFDVKTGTRLFVPILSIDDSPPVFGVYPADKSGLADYYFDPSQFGIEVAQIEVDGKVTDLGPDYIGAVFGVALPMGGNNFSQLGAFLTPLTKGEHTITIGATLSGDLVGGVPFSFEITYTVTVK